MLCVLSCFYKPLQTKLKIIYKLYQFILHHFYLEAMSDDTGATAPSLVTLSSDTILG